MNAIQTKYRGTNFRSRLEARWAAFFDALGWPYDYEPLDLNGYIPDFVLHFYEPLLVEVKPALSFADLAQHEAKIEQSGWQHNALIVGARIFFEEPYCVNHNDYHPRLGALSQHYAAGWFWSEGRLINCTSCKKYGIFHDCGAWYCLRCGNGGKDVLGDVRDEIIKFMWNEAGSTVQWNPWDRR